jgi:hypothetical protein
MMVSRAQYVAYRVGARMQNRGDPMVLRRTTLAAGPVPYRNPPDSTADIAVITGTTFNGQAYLGVGGSSVIGRLIPGDQVVTTPASGPAVLWTVGIMPITVALDSDAIPLVDGSGNPAVAASQPALYTPDSRAASDQFNCIPVSAAGAPDPAASIGDAVSFVFLADQAVYGATLSFEEQIELGWTDVDTIGLRIAAYNAGTIAPPKVDDLIFVSGGVRAIITVGQTFRQGVSFLYTVQAR